MTEMSKVMRNTTLELVGIGAFTTGIGLVASGKIAEGVIVAGIGAGAIVLKYLTRKDQSL